MNYTPQKVLYIPVTSMVYIFRFLHENVNTTTRYSSFLVFSKFCRICIKWPKIVKNATFLGFFGPVKAKKIFLIQFLMKLTFWSHLINVKTSKIGHFQFSRFYPVFHLILISRSKMDQKSMQMAIKYELDGLPWSI